jgi:hypothetical protein
VHPAMNNVGMTTSNKINDVAFFMIITYEVSEIPFFWQIKSCDFHFLEIDRMMREIGSGTKHIQVIIDKYG